MPRPAGYVTSQEEKDRIADSQRRNWEQKRGPWVAVSRQILAASEEGDSELAHQILETWILKRAKDKRIAARAEKKARIAARVAAREESMSS